MRQEGEPSVEEILASIKKVIARDDAETAQAASAPRKRAGLVAESDSASTQDDVLDLGVIGSAISEDEANEELIEERAADEGLTNDAAADAMRQSLAALAMLAEPPAKPQIVRQGETSLEGMVREMLRPMLAQWLDANLPGMVEEMVKAEIARIAGKKR